MDIVEELKEKDALAIWRELNIFCREMHIYMKRFGNSLLILEYNPKGEDKKFARMKASPYKKAIAVYSNWEPKNGYILGRRLIWHKE